MGASESACTAPAPTPALEVKAEAKFERKVSDYTHGVRTQHDSGTSPERALEKLREGNARFVKGGDTSTDQFKPEYLTALAVHGQAPMVSVLGCADSRAPIEIMFDCKPGDIFVLRNAGNSLSHAEGSVVGSLEYSIGPLGAKLILVLGHTKCGAMAGATQVMLNAKTAAASGAPAKQTTLEKLLAGLAPVAAQAQQELPSGASEAEIAAKAIEVNVFAGMARLLIYSEPVREKVKSGDVQVHGAVYDIVTGEVKFLGQHPKQKDILEMGAGSGDHALGA